MAQTRQSPATRLRESREARASVVEVAPELSWLLLIVSLPTSGATTRMRIWRSLKVCGAAAMRDGVYLMPAGPGSEATMEQLAQECSKDAGSAWLMIVQPRDLEEQSAYVKLFDRTAEYADLRARWKESTKDLDSMGFPELNRLQKRLQREWEAFRATDFFPNSVSADAEAAWIELMKRFKAAVSPDEPSGSDGRIPRLDLKAYQGRTWATRKHLWVDRVASAWLIRRFIDKRPTFHWLDTPTSCPGDALGFDFDEATFTHVGNRVTFETLMASFGLDSDPALARLGAMVHFLDMGGEPSPEAGGFEAVLAGAREMVPNDDALLDEISKVLDSLYTHFQRDARLAQ